MSRPSRLAAKVFIASSLLVSLSIISLLTYNASSMIHSRLRFDSLCQYPQACRPGPLTNEPALLPAPSAPNPTIPEKIWYKAGPKGISSESQEWINQCLNRNPTFRHEFLTDTSGEAYVRESFSHRPDIVTTYASLNVPILRADLLRYLILYADGGMWSDLDVSCEEIPINTWIPSEVQGEVSLVVGLEFDWSWANDNFLHSQFASWTIMAKPGLRHISVIIEDVLVGINQLAVKNNVSVSELDFGMIDEVVDLTGPKRMTRGIVKSLEYMLGETIDDRNISGLVAPKLLGDVLILPANSFAASQAGYPMNQGPALVTHHYAGSWKNDHGGEEIKP